MFALSPEESSEEAAEAEELLQSAAKAVVDRRMATPVLLFLEMYRPLGFVGYQALLVIEPTLQLFLSPARTKRLLSLLEHRGRIERFVQLIQETEQEGTRP